VNVTLPTVCVPPTTTAPPTTVAPTSTTSTTTTTIPAQVLGESITRPAVATPVEVLPRFAG
jgi:hypothetical protein